MQQPAGLRYCMLDLWYIMPRSQGGVFVAGFFLTEIWFGLTIVNKPHVTCLKSYGCSKGILPLIKASVLTVNKSSLFFALFFKGG